MISHFYLWREIRTGSYPGLPSDNHTLVSFQFLAFPLRAAYTGRGYQTVISIVQPARGLPAGFWGGSVWSGLLMAQSGRMGPVAGLP